MSDCHPRAALHLPALQRHWLEAQSLSLLNFARRSRLQTGGFGALDENGHLDPSAATDTILTARHTHSFCLAMMLGIPGYDDYARHGVIALETILQDHTHGGWFLNSAPEEDSTKQAYCHAFVALAASSAHVCGVPGAEALLSRAIDAINIHFWAESEGAMRESFSRDWRQEEAYRGANANMHSVEAFLALADALNAPLWTDRALQICTRIIHDHASHAGFQVIEHFDRHWSPLPDYNQDKPADILRPYGTTPGHGLEWSHLLLKLECSLLRAGRHVPGWVLPASRGLFEAAMHHGWIEGEHPGLVYTLDGNKNPNVTHRVHWSMAEAINASASLAIRTGDEAYRIWHRRLWNEIAAHFIDPIGGSWWNELDEANRPSNAMITPGKSDLYHAFQATLSPTLPLSSSFARAIRETA